MMVRASDSKHVRYKKLHFSLTSSRDGSRDHPDRNYFMSLLRECSLYNDIRKGFRIHSEIARIGSLQDDIFLGSILINMYAECGSLAKAEEAFESLPFRDVVVWTTLIGGYAGYGLHEKAFECIEKMQQDGISPDAFTLVCILKVCGNAGAVERGKAIHCDIIRKGLLENNFFLGSILVDMYVKFGALASARAVFDKVQKRDVVIWNALVGGYAEEGSCTEAFGCLFQMQDEGISPSTITLVSILKMCGSSKSSLNGQQLHMEIVGRGLENELLIGSTLMDMYAKCGLLLEARNLFDSGPVHDIVAWNILIMGYAENDCGEEALSVLEQMQENGMSPNDVTYIGCLKACAIIGNTSQGQNKGRESHAEVFKKGFDTEPLIGSVLIDMYIKCHFLAEAQQVFDTLPSGDMISSSSLISGYAKHGWSEGAAYCLEKKVEEGISSNAVTLLCELKASGNAGSTSMGAKIHAEIIKKGFEGEAMIGNSLVAMYAKCGLVVEAQEVFDKLPVRDTTSWNALLLGYANVGESKSVFYVFEKTVAECMGLCPVTFLSLLNACSHCGLVREGLVCIEIVGSYKIAVSIDHYACMVDLFARAGDIGIAEEMIEKMPFHPDVAMWHMLLAACWRTTNVELGREIFGHALQLDEEDISAYVCMSNIYADRSSLCKKLIRG